jgi:phosphoglycolate phosphatase-like HAD superfamily hydrolase
MVVVFIDLDDTLIVRTIDAAGKRMADDLIAKMIEILHNHHFPVDFLNELRNINRTSLFWNAVMEFLDHSQITKEQVVIVRNELDEVLLRHEHDDHRESYLPEETKPFLESLIQKGYRLVMLTNTSRIELNATLLKYDLAKYFIASITRDDVRKIKPDLEGVRKILDTLGEPCFVIIDDLDYGVTVAKEAQTHGYRSFSILVDRGKYSQEQLKQLHPDAIVTSLEEIPKLLPSMVNSSS